MITPKYICERIRRKANNTISHCVILMIGQIQLNLIKVSDAYF